MKIKILQQVTFGGMVRFAGTECTCPEALAQKLIARHIAAAVECDMVPVVPAAPADNPSGAADGTDEADSGSGADAGEGADGENSEPKPAAVKSKTRYRA